MNTGWSYREQVGPEQAGQTVLAHLSSKYRHSTESEWGARLDRGEVEVGGVRVDRDAMLSAGQILIWHRPPWNEGDVPATYDIIHLDESIIAVNKPSGLPTMPGGGFLENTLASMLRREHPESSPLHRLGRFTSGVVLFSRTHRAAMLLARSWRDHEVIKIYRALVSGSPKTPTLVIDAPIGPVPHPLLDSVYAASDTGKPSHSVATVLESRGDRTLVRVEITTGRPHQIRIHLAYAGHPLIGDPLYEAGGVVKADPGLPGDGGYRLHAEKLQFAHPATGERMTLVAAPPPQLQLDGLMA